MSVFGEVGRKDRAIFRSAPRLAWPEAEEPAAGAMRGFVLRKRGALDADGHLVCHSWPGPTRLFVTDLMMLLAARPSLWPSSVVFVGGALLVAGACVGVGIWSVRTSHPVAGLLCVMPVPLVVAASILVIDGVATWETS